MTAAAFKASSDNYVIGRNLRRLRRDAKMSLQEVGDILGVSYQQVQKYETGANRLPLQCVPPLCDLFGVPAEAFLDGIMKADHKPARDPVLELCQSVWPGDDVAVSDGRYSAAILLLHGGHGTPEVLKSLASGKAIR